MPRAKKPQFNKPVSKQIDDLPYLCIKLRGDWKRSQLKEAKAALQKAMYDVIHKEPEVKRTDPVD